MLGARCISYSVCGQQRALVVRMASSNADSMVHMLQPHARPGVRLAYERVLPRAKDGAGTAGILMCYGLQSNRASGKAQMVLQLACEQECEGVIFDYQGHGESSGAFGECGLSDWVQDTLDILDLAVMSQKVVVVGSSIGGWVALRVAQLRPGRVQGLVLVAPAVDRTEERWQALSPEGRKALLSSGSVHQPSPYLTHPDGQPGFTIGLPFFTQGSSHLLLTPTPAFPGASPAPPASALARDLALCPVHILHGDDDDCVPLSTSLRLFGALTGVAEGEVQDVLGERRLGAPWDPNAATGGDGRNGDGRSTLRVEVKTLAQAAAAGVAAGTGSSEERGREQGREGAGCLGKGTMTILEQQPVRKLPRVETTVSSGCGPHNDGPKLAGVGESWEDGVAARVLGVVHGGDHRLSSDEELGVLKACVVGMLL